MGYISWLIILLIILFSSNNIASASEKDRLLVQISKEASDTTRIKLIVRYAMIYAQARELKRLYDEISRLSLKNHYRPGLIYTRFFEVLCLADSGRQDEAIEKCKRCIDGLDSLGVIQPIDYPLYNIHFLFKLAGKPVEMFRYYSDKLIFYRNHGPIENTGSCYHGLALYYYSIADYDKAIGYYLRALDVYSTFDPLGVLNERGIIGEMYMEWGNLDKAEFYLKTALKNQESSTEVFDNDSYDLSGNFYFKKHEFRKALQCFLEGKKHIKEMEPFFQANNHVRVASVYLQLGLLDSAKIYLDSAEMIRKKEQTGIYFTNNFLDIDFYFYMYNNATGNEKRALQSLKAALGKAQSSKNILLVLKCTNELHSFLIKRGDSLQAFHYLIKYHALKDSVEAVNTQARIASFEIEQQQQQKENEILQLQIQKTTQRNYYLIGGTLLLLIVLVVLSRLRYKRKRDSEQLATEFKKQLAEAETKALRAQMNPHFIFNSLNSINSLVMEQKHEIASEYLIKFSKLIRLILDNSRSERISLEKELETLKLYVILESARFDGRFKCVYTIADDINASSIMIPPMLLQPFVENAIWHGLMQKEGEGAIIIEIKWESEEFLSISITDDGIGREKAAQLKSKSATHKSHGLKVTSERIEMMNKLNSTGARVNITDLKDERGNAAGTKVKIIIPV
ncbi:MAG: histidine kinase [Bacteroidota bacterium]